MSRSVPPVVSAWPTPTIVPYPIWLETLWNEAVEGAALTEAPLLLTPAQAAQLWRGIVAAEGMPLLDPHGAATLAAEAWALVHEWGAGGESWRAWRQDVPEPDDAAVFARWSESYLGAAAARAGAGSRASSRKARGLADRVAAAGATTILAGFTELSPQQERLVPRWSPPAPTCVASTRCPNARHGRHERRPHRRVTRLPPRSTGRGRSPARTRGADRHRRRGLARTARRDPGAGRGRSLPGRAAARRRFAARAVRDVARCPLGHGSAGRRRAGLDRARRIPPCDRRRSGAAALAVSAAGRADPGPRARAANAAGSMAGGAK